MTDRAKYGGKRQDEGRSVGKFPQSVGKFPQTSADTPTEY